MALEVTNVAASNVEQVTTTFNGETTENLKAWNTGHGKAVITYVGK